MKSSAGCASGWALRRGGVGMREFFPEIAHSPTRFQANGSEQVKHYSVFLKHTVYAWIPKMWRSGSHSTGGSGPRKSWKLPRHSWPLLHSSGRGRGAVTFITTDKWGHSAVRIRRTLWLCRGKSRIRSASDASEPGSSSLCPRLCYFRSQQARQLLPKDSLPL